MHFIGIICVKHNIVRVHELTRGTIMLDTNTLKNIHSAINDNDHETVEFMRGEAIKELSRLKIAEINIGLNAYEKRDVDVNVEIITEAEAKLNGD